MGEVIALIRVMPTEILNDEQMDELKKRIEGKIKDPAKLARIDIKDIAFGLRALDVTVVVPDAEGGVDPIAEELAKMDGVESAEVVDVGRI
ncbi:MAG: elongation factor 1-beta [Thermoplasmata archaeon]|nr:MAG: elongation factor 1-beta [Thermoplasmata archaeon]KAA0015532.1 MAG: elongation factor 1-beta [Thermoplasmata archaeon]